MLRMDHSALQWLLNLEDPEGLVARWIQQLQEYDFQIQHRKGPHIGMQMDYLQDSAI